MSRPFLSVVIPTYNRKDLLKECLESLFNQTYPKEDYEIVVVDDGSTDGTEEALKGLRAEHGNLRYFRQENKGPAAARNLGAFNSLGRLLIFINDDGRAPREFFKKMVTCLDGNPGISSCVGSSIPVYRSRLFGLLSGHFKNRYKHDHILSGLSFGRRFDSNCLGMQRTVFEKTGGFDERFKWAGEDGDLECRLLETGEKILLSKDIFTLHEQKDSIGAMLLRHHKLGFAETCTFKDHFRNWLVVFLPFERTVTIKKFPVTACICLDHLKIIILMVALAFIWPVFSLALISAYVIFGCVKAGGLKLLLQLTLYRTIIYCGYFSGWIAGSFRNGIIFV
ncbi:MAG: glycosyltransferase [Candidatus Omnitrophota bacterium]|jgi:glycosyltransferase involved in cell wall biosynthesis